MYNGNYIKFLYEDDTEVLGSDGISPYDGRLGVYGIVKEAKRRLKSIQNIKPSITKYVIYRRDRIVKGN